MITIIINFKWRGNCNKTLLHCFLTEVSLLSDGSEPRLSGMCKISKLLKISLDAAIVDGSTLISKNCRKKAIGRLL